MDHGGEQGDLNGSDGVQEALGEIAGDIVLAGHIVVGATILEAAHRQHDGSRTSAKDFNDLHQ